MAECVDKLQPHVENASFPFWIIDKLRDIKINGLLISTYGGLDFSVIDSGAITFELSKYDASVSTFFMVQNGLGMGVIEAFGDDEQRERILPAAMNFDRLIGFGLTEPQNGSDASSILTTATKTEGGWKLNG